MLAEDFCKGNAPERSRPFPTAHVEVAYKHWQYRIILSADTASEVRQMLSQKRR